MGVIVLQRAAALQSTTPALRGVPPAQGAQRSFCVVSPSPASGADLQALARDAAPGSAVVVAESVKEALAAGPAGALADILVLDARHWPTGEFARQLRLLSRLLARLEVVVVADDRSIGAFPVCLQIIADPGRLTFLMAPLDRLSAVETLRTVQARAEAVAGLDHVSAEFAARTADLTLEVELLQTGLKVAQYAARHDDLTGALNRFGFMEDLTARLVRTHQSQTVLIVDLDRFKLVNDTLGHEAGDDLVRKVCIGIQGVLPPDALLARLGGDEFGVILESSSEQRARQVCDEILAVCGKSRFVLGHETQISASIGVSLGETTSTERELMRQADLALYAAKREGRSRYRIFDEALDRVTRYRLSIETGLEKGLRAGQFEMAYQPLVDAHSAEIQGFEALIRWRSPEYGLVSPSEFIPVAEETGLILELGDWITRQALRDCRRWPGQYVSINLSVRQFLRHNVGERILRYAREAQVDPKRIQIELTETAIIDDVERAAANLAVMRNAGVRVALDDFGTGYSSLVYLKQFAIDCIKIDKSFVDNITRDKQSAVIVASVAKLAASLNMNVVAEGVETEAQRTVLLAAGCDVLQGYHFSRPVTAAEALAMTEPARLVTGPALDMAPLSRPSLRL